jgi:hypothetical protein
MAAVFPTPAAPVSSQPPVSGRQGSLLRVLSNDELVRQEKNDADEKKALEEQQHSQEIQGIAAYVRRCWIAAWTAKQEHERDMLNALRMRNGQYADDVLAEINAFGGTNLYMRIGATKMRAAQSWLKDIFLNIDRPFKIDPTPEPTLPEDINEQVTQTLQQMVEQAAQQGIPPPDELQLREMQEKAMESARSAVMEKAKKRALAMENKLDDILVEGGFYQALDEIMCDITTYKGCIIKGPVVRKKPVLKWSKNSEGKTTPVITSEYKYMFERVNPLLFYPAPQTRKLQGGYMIQRHRLQRVDLGELIGVEGYSEPAIRQVLETYGRGGLNNWLAVDAAEQRITNPGVPLNNTPEPYIEALEFWGGIQGQMLLEWGMSPEQIADKDIDYRANVWVIGPYVIRAVLNHDPLGRIPYCVTAWEKTPTGFWGTGVGELLQDVQDVCNATARALVNNIAISSGPQVAVNKDRLADGQNVKTLSPWYIWQTKNDPFGSTEEPIKFFQPKSNAAELHGVYDKFATIADEVSSIPRYMMGDTQVGGAGRTAAGLSMLMNAANKGIKNVANNIDTDIIVPMIERLFYYVMVYDEDESVKGDVAIRAKGASGLMLKELLNQRRLEFLQIVTPFVQSGLVPPEVLLEILKELSQGLEFPEGMLPTPEDFKAHLQQMQQQQEMAAQQQDAAATDNVNIKHDDKGRMVSATMAPAGRAPKKPMGQQDVAQQLRGNFIPGMGGAQHMGGPAE